MWKFLVVNASTIGYDENTGVVFTSLSPPHSYILGLAVDPQSLYASGVHMTTHKMAVCCGRPGVVTGAVHTGALPQGLWVAVFHDAAKHFLQAVCFCDTWCTR
jgi:hypothetical protein